MVNFLLNEVENQLVLCGVTLDEKIVAGVSGGPDSLALMHILKELYPQGNLVIGHLNHKLRDEADDEALFVRRTADSWNIPIIIAEQDVQSMAKNSGLSIEEVARKARYEFLLDVAKEENAQFILVAHHADDQVETIILNLLRGSGLTGLKGMEMVRSLSDDSNIRLVRPFLNTWREAILAYCNDHQLKPVYDSSNEDITYRRNQIRHEILPLLLKINPGFKENIQQLIDLVKADEAYLFQQTKLAFDEIILQKDANLLRLDRSKWQALPLSLQRRTLRFAVQYFQDSVKNVSYRTIGQACQVAQSGMTGAKSILPGNLILQVGYLDLLISPRNSKISINYPQIFSSKGIKKLTIPGIVELKGGWKLSAEPTYTEMDDIGNNNYPWQAFIALELEHELFVRGREPGERFQPLGMNGRSVSVQDFMVNSKIPADYRNYWPIVATISHPVWIAGHRIDERAKVNLAKKSAILLKCFRIKEPE